MGHIKSIYKGILPYDNVELYLDEDMSDMILCIRFEITPTNKLSFRNVMLDKKTAFSLGKELVKISKEMVKYSTKKVK